MLRLTPPEAGKKLVNTKSLTMDFAGSESNVASSLATLGHDSHFVTILPDNQLGEAAMSSIRSYGINTDYIAGGAGRMGTYFIESGTSIRPSIVLYDRAYSAFSNISANQFEWERILNGTSWLFVSGITAALSENCKSELIKLVEIAKKLKVKIAFDMNYRRKLWSDPSSAQKVFESIVPEIDLLLGNSGVISDLYGNDKKSDEELMQKLMDDFKVKTIAFTQRKHLSASENELSAVLLDGTNFYRSPTYTIDVLDRFGTGDAFAAGCIHGLSKSSDLQWVIQFAGAAFALKHTIKGDQHVSTEEEINSIVSGNITGHVQR